MKVVEVPCKRASVRRPPVLHFAEKATGRPRAYEPRYGALRGGDAIEVR